MENIKLNLSTEEIDFLKELLAIEVEKNLCRLERNVDVEENNIQKINTSREIQIKIIQTINNNTEDVVGSLSFDEDDDVYEETEVDDEFEADCLEVLNLLHADVDGEWVAEQIANGGYSLEEYAEELAKGVEEYFLVENIYKDLDDIEFKVVQDICYDYITQFEDVLDLFV